LFKQSTYSFVPANIQFARCVVGTATKLHLWLKVCKLQ